MRLVSIPGNRSENVAAQIPRHSHKCEARRPAGDPPQEIIRCDQRHEKNECQPYAACAGRAGRQTVDQILHAILRAYRTSNCCHNGGQDDDMRRKTVPKIAQDERKRAIGVS
jgi:hypothetical protein